MGFSGVLESKNWLTRTESSLIKNEWLSNSIEWIIFIPMRIRTRIRSHHKYKVRQNALVTIRKTLEKAINLNVDNHRIIFNVALYLMLLDQDLADFTDDIINATGNRKRVFIAKHEAILLYEASEDITQLLGKEFRQALGELCIPEAQLQKLNASSAKLNQFWKKNREYLKSIRNNLSAHRTDNALEYIKALEKLEPLAVMRVAVELSDCINPLANILSGIALSTSGIQSMLHDWLISSKKKKAS